jgi:hypothetical protein
VANESYSNNPVSPNIQNLLGYFSPVEDSFRIVNKSIASWSFNGGIPSRVSDIKLWDAVKNQSNVLPGDYAIVKDQLGEYVARPVITVEPLDPAEFFDISDEPVTKIDYTITGASISGSSVTYTTSVDHNFTTNTFVTISGISPSQFNQTKARVTGKTNNTFTISKTISGSYSSGGKVYAQAKFDSNIVIKYLNSSGLEADYIIETYIGDDGYPANYIEIIREDWSSKYLGSSGWILSASGNSIFNNVAIRGEITADTLDVGGGEGITYDGTTVRLGTDVTIDGSVTADSFSIDANNFWNTAGHLGDFRVGNATTSYLYFNSTLGAAGTLEVKGNIIATSGSFSGNITSTATISGGAIEGATITGGTLRLGSASTASVFKVNPTSGLWLGAQDFADAPFSVTLAGALKATSGSIAGMTLSGTSISFGNSGNYVALSSDGTYALWAGANDSAIAPFSVKRDGTLYATGANISGTINATSGSFSGSITASDGSIGGWIVGPTSISKAVTTGTHSSIYVGTGTYGNANTPFFISSEGKFSLKDKLGFDGTNLTVTGAINATSGNFTGNVKVDTGGKIYVGSSPTTGQRVVVSDTGITGVDNSGITVFNLPATGTTPPTITNFNVLEAKITGEGANAYLIAGTTGASATNVTVRGDKTGGQAAAIYNTISGTATTATSGNGFYIDDTGKFRFATGTNSITGSNGNLTVTGKVIASTIRGSDVYADSVQLGGSEFGWVSGSGGIFSGTDQSTTYLQSGFYANPITALEQELDGGVIKEYTLSTTGVTCSASPRSLFLTFSSEVLNVKKGYQIYTGTGTSRLLVGIVDEVIDLNTVRLRSVPSRFIVNEQFSIRYVKSTITTQFFAGFTPGTKVSIESPEGTEYDISAIDFEAGALETETITYQIPPRWTNIYDKTPIEYEFKSAFLTESSGEINDIQLDIQSITAQKSTVDGVDYYDALIKVKASDIFVDGELILSIGQNIFVGNVPNDSEFFYPLINSYFPIINIVANGLDYYDILIYADGYLSFDGSSKTDSFAKYSINKFSCFDNKITLTTTTNHRFIVGQVVDLEYVSTPYLDGSWSLEPRVISDVTSNTFSFQYVFPNTQDSVVVSSTTKASSFPTVTKKSYDKDHSIWIGASNPTDAPFSIDSFGQNVKIKNLEVTGTVTGLYYDIIELDDFSGAFDGRKVSFLPTYNYKEFVIDNPLKLVLSVNGVLQSAFIKNREYVWQTGFLGFNGYTVDEYGQIKFSESPPPGSTVNARVFPGPQKNKTSRIYPFKAVDIALG